ncbi:MAG: hypothetical protein PHQ89_03630 [Bacilli bacterium]|nr:hypothetical protein [Bacilli bacterium]
MKKLILAVILISMAVMAQSSHPEDTVKKAQQIEENIRPYLSEEEKELEAVQEVTQDTDNIKGKTEEKLDTTSDTHEVSIDKNTVKNSEKQTNQTVHKTNENQTSSLSEKDLAGNSKNNLTEFKTTQTDESKSNKHEATSHDKTETDSSVKEETKPQYHAGNSGLLLNSESEAYQEAEKKFNDFSDSEKYVSNYVVYSTYDKWTISYYYTYY